MPFAALLNSFSWSDGSVIEAIMTLALFLLLFCVWSQFID